MIKGINLPGVHNPPLGNPTFMMTFLSREKKKEIKERGHIIHIDKRV